ncbi:hypothetical protein Tco_0190178 [Tanacetum coccineum]
MTTANQGMRVEEIEQIVAQRVANAIEAIAIYESIISQTARRENKSAIFTILASVQKNVAIENGGATKQEIVGSQFRKRNKDP